MRMFSILSAVLVSAFLVGCSSTQDVSAGAMGKSGECCPDSAACCPADAKAAPGAMGEKSECCPSACTKTEAAAPGAMSEDCASKCSGAKGAEASPGALAEPKTCPMSGKCSGSKTSE